LQTQTWTETGTLTRKSFSPCVRRSSLGRND
jgi:hypothetical protein